MMKQIRNSDRKERCICDDGSCDYCIKYYADSRVEEISSFVDENLWLRQRYTNGERVVEVAVPHKDKYVSSNKIPNKVWDEWAAFRMARRILSRPVVQS